MPVTTVPNGTGNVVSNSVVQVSLIPGWSESSQSSATSLELAGPDGISAIFSTTQVQPGVTLSQVFNNQISRFQNDSNLINVTVCAQPASGIVPGGQKIAGGGATVCFTATNQSGTAEQWIALLFDGLLKSSNGGSQLLVSEVAFSPAANGSSLLVQELRPVLQSARWLQVNG